MTPTGNVREYRVVIGPQPADTEVRYWFTAADTSGFTVTWPPAGEADPFRVRVGPDAVPPRIEHEALRNQPVDADAFRLVARVTDNLDRGVDSVRVVAAVDAESEVPLTLASLGEDAYEAVLPYVGRPLGSAVRYRFTVEDSANVPNHAAFPDTGWVRFMIVRGLGRDFEANDGGLVPGGDWEWGNAEPLRRAHSGERLWATNLDGVYGDSQRHDLTLGPVDLSAFSRAGLYFQTAYDIEAGWDGGTVFASRDGGLEWEILRPDGDYPYPSVEVSGHPAFSGKQTTWRPAAFDLTAFLGEPDVRIRFTLASDPAVAGQGWYLDDLEVVERQVLSRPIGLRAWSGRDHRVPLVWSPPVGIPLAAPATPLLGYHIDRAEEGGGTWTRITTGPLDTLAFEDTTAVNGVPYRYGAVAVYAEGESPRSNEVAALPYLAVFSAPRDTLVATLPAGGDTMLVLSVSNAGTGFLGVNAWPAGESQGLDDVRALFIPDPLASAPPDTGLSFGPDPALYEIVFDNDPAGEPPPGLADLRRLEAESLNGNLYFRITAHAAWGNPLEAFTFLVAMETDDNLDTGPAGGDFTLVAGWAVQSGSGIPAVILDGSEVVVGFPDYVDMGTGATTAEFGFPLSLIGTPDRILFTVRTLGAAGGVLVDRMPDAPPVSWIELDARHLEVAGGDVVPLPVRLASGELPQATYRAGLLLETNAPAEPAVRIPVALTVAPITPVDLLAFTAESGDLGIRLAWRVSADVEPPGFLVFRREEHETEETRLTPELLAGSGRGDYVFEDETVIEGRTYFYRIAEVDRRGELTWHGPLVARYDGAAALSSALLRPGMPNPAARSTRVRFGLPLDGPVRLRIYDLRGRSVRALIDGETFPRGFHERLWDLRDDAGRRVASGIYLLRLDAGGTSDTRKISVVPAEGD